MVLPSSTLLLPATREGEISTVRPRRCTESRELCIELCDGRAKLLAGKGDTREAIKELKCCIDQMKEMDGSPKLKEEATSLLLALQIGDAQAEQAGYGGYGGYGGY